MRIWSLHPKYLDAKGLVALWREALLAKHVLQGKTKGYKSHPQLDRFKKCAEPVEAVDQYLAGVYKEAETRGYNFDRGKINWKFRKTKIPVTTDQVSYETRHLLKKLKTRDPKKFKELRTIERFVVHPLFKQKKGVIEDWEIVQ